MRCTGRQDAADAAALHPQIALAAAANLMVSITHPPVMLGS